MSAFIKSPAQASVRSLSALRPYSTPAVRFIPSVSGITGLSQHGIHNSLSQKTPLVSFMTRQYSTRQTTQSQFRSTRVGTLGLALAQRRSFFGGPSQSTLARLEQAANNNPNSAAAQAQFYSALLRANMPQIVVDRHRTGHGGTFPLADRSPARTGTRRWAIGSGQAERSPHA